MTRVGWLINCPDIFQCYAGGNRHKSFLLRKVGSASIASFLTCVLHPTDSCRVRGLLHDVSIHLHFGPCTAITRIAHHLRIDTFTWHQHTSFVRFLCVLHRSQLLVPLALLLPLFLSIQPCLNSTPFSRSFAVLRSGALGSEVNRGVNPGVTSLSMGFRRLWSNWSDATHQRAGFAPPQDLARK